MIVYTLSRTLPGGTERSVKIDVESIAEADSMLSAAWDALNPELMAERVRKAEHLFTELAASILKPNPEEA